MNIQDISEFLDLVKNPEKYEGYIAAIKEEQARLEAVAETVVKVSEFDKEKKKFEKERDKMKKQLETALEEMESTKISEYIKNESMQKQNQAIKEENEMLNKQIKEKNAICDAYLADLKNREAEIARQEQNLSAAVASTEETRKQLEEKLAAIRSLGV